jgi:uncharacterized protein YdaU (DUF1376 family)
MNYFEHHIGDYDEATSHLTACEDGIYCRLIRKYMAKEQPLPNDLPALQRLVRARTREEKNAVASVLTEFFILLDDGFHQKTCDEAIEKFRAGEPEREVKKANEDNRLKRHREERAALFRKLTEAGEHAPWNIAMAELREMVKRVEARHAETQLPPFPATAPATPATATQSPSTNTQYPVVNLKTFSPTGDSDKPAHEDSDAFLGAAAVSVALIGWERDRNKAARGINASHPTVIELSEMHVSLDELRKAYDMAVADRLATEDPNPVNAGFVKSFVVKVRNPPKPRPKADNWHTTEPATDRKAAELGITPRPGENYTALRDRMWSEIRRRETQGVPA